MLSGIIQLSLDKITEINRFYLQNKMLDAPIPANLGNCKQWILLRLSQIIWVAKQLPFVATLTVWLNLAQNCLFGQLPFDIGNLVNLNDLDISNNRLSSESYIGTIWSMTIQIIMLQQALKFQWPYKLSNNYEHKLHM